MLSVTPSGQRADDWIRTSMSRFTRAAPLSRATSACLGADAVLLARRTRFGVRAMELQRDTKHECKESNPVRQFWRLAALPGAHSCKGSRAE